jgi:hypothetical protein
MDNIYNCVVCNYETLISSNYKQHLMSKKHIVRSNDKTVNITKSNTNKIIKSDRNTFYCKYCKNNYKGRGNKARHYKKCVGEYSKIQDKLLLKEEEEREKENKLKEQYDELLKVERRKAKKAQYKMLKDLVIDIIKNINVGSTNITNNNTNNYNNNNVSNNCVNFNYIKKNFTNPLTLEECFKPPLTDIEKENIIKSTPTVGCEYLITSRCVTGLDIDKRPIHNIDLARNRFAVYCGEEPNKSWVSKEGKYIINKFIPLVAKQYNELLKKADGDKCLMIAQELYNLQTTGKKKLEKSIGELTYIKNTLSAKDSEKYKRKNKDDKHDKSDSDSDSDRDIDSDELEQVHDRLIKNKLDKANMLKSIMQVINSMSDNEYCDDDEYIEESESDKESDPNDISIDSDNEVNE